MQYSFSSQECEKVIAHFGQEFYDKVLGYTEYYSDKWKLSQMQLVDYYSINCIFTCYSSIYGDSVLKICNASNNETSTEYNALKEFNGRGICKLFAADIEKGVMLIERLLPGTQLKDEPLQEKRLTAFLSLLSALHVEPANPNIYPSYTDWVSRITDYMSNQSEYQQLYNHMLKAKELYLTITKTYNKQMLLHGDFHYENILLGSNDHYVVIDPKGVIGDPVFDTPRYILNECYRDDIGETLEQRLCTINDIIQFLGKKLNIPCGILKQCLYVETAMSECWMVESNETPDMDNVLFAEMLLTY